MIMYLFRWISLSSLVFPLPRCPFLVLSFNKGASALTGRRLVSNSFTNPLALFRISLSSSSSFFLLLLYLFLSLSLYLRHPKQLSTIRIPFISSFGTIINFKSKIRKLNLATFVARSSRDLLPIFLRTRGGKKKKRKKMKGKKK